MPNNNHKELTIVSCQWLHDNIDIVNLIVLDASVSSKESISKTYIPKSRYFDIKGKFSDTKASFPNTIPPIEKFQEEAQVLGINGDSLVVVYDDKGIYWSPRVWWLFKTFGFDRVMVLDGGLPEWKRLNYKTVDALAVPNWKKGNFKSNYRVDYIHDFKHMSALSNDENVIILDARSEERFTCQISEPRVGLRSGTIPNSKNLPYTQLLDGYCLKSKEELKAIFDTFNIGDKLVTFSCGSGITACILALVAKVLDYHNVSVYDGSWTEYGTLTT